MQVIKKKNKRTTSFSDHCSTPPYHMMAGLRERPYFGNRKRLPLLGFDPFPAFHVLSERSVTRWGVGPIPAFQVLSEQSVTKCPPHGLI